MEKNNVSVEERVQNVLAYLAGEADFQRISVTRVCALADVSRANLYQHHRHLVQVIRRMAQPLVPVLPSKKAIMQKSSQQLKKELAVLRLQAKALTLVCLEQGIVIDNLTARLKSEVTLKSDRPSRSKLQSA